ncbi:hypothetical protein F8144_43885 [Streptomyces triticiradicis]|uniref:Uncharacterized protein n=1 Tax=Streptomyces triticiradicis TaxID=2651189 RepID=A0A7J5D196_9ACTN|nr:hypothetical protein F8144_43885 [Streptomyces triticiradicis]
MRTARLRSVHPVLWAGWAALAAGAVLCVIGWYGVSGERFAERQLPYLASCTVPGAALIIAGAVLLAHGGDASAAARVEELYGLLVAAGSADDGEPGPAAAPVAVSGDLLMVPGGTLYHRADCPLVAGKPEAVPADSRVLASGDLGPCPICEPDAEDTPSGGTPLTGRPAAPGRPSAPDGPPAPERPPTAPDG